MSFARIQQTTEQPESKPKTIDRQKLRDIIEVLERGSERDIPATIEALKQLGAVRNIHIGEPMQDGDDRCVEWYAGQALDILEVGALFAVNSLCNTLDKFVPLEGPKGERP